MSQVYTWEFCEKNHTFIRSHGIRTLSMVTTSTTHFNEILWSSARLSLYPLVHHFLHQDGDKVTGDEVKSNSHNGIFVLVISMHDIATVKWLVSILFNTVLNRQQTQYLNQQFLILIINFSTLKMYRSWYCQCIIVLYNPFWSTQTALLKFYSTLQAYCIILHSNDLGLRYVTL